MYVHLCIFIHMSVHICAHIFPICAASAGEGAQQAVSCVNASPASSWGAGGKLFPSDHQSGFWLIRAMILMIMIRIGWVLNVFGKSFWSRSSQFQRQEMVAPYSKRVLFVCERNLAESAMAEVNFQILSFLCMWEKMQNCIFLFFGVVVYFVVRQSSTTWVLTWQEAGRVILLVPRWLIDFQNLFFVNFNT